MQFNTNCKGLYENQLLMSFYFAITHRNRKLLTYQCCSHPSKLISSETLNKYIRYCKNNRVHSSQKLTKLLLLTNVRKIL